MFGQLRKQRQKNAANQQAEFARQQAAANDPARLKAAEDAKNAQVAGKVDQSKKDRQTAYGEGRQRAEELFSRDIQGLDPKKRAALQAEANIALRGATQGANRKILGDQAARGVVGKGGVGYAQQRELQRAAAEGQGQINRDLTKLDSDLAMKKLAAMFNVEQGEATQQQLDKQLALDELNLLEEQKRGRRFEDQFSQLFNRI